ncbi:MAG: hypothetical protein KF754_09450 [Planctomycetes bacterium]|nr:hypothetical protein [Planctomycetota bacterium]
MGVFSRTMLMLTMAWLVGLIVTFLFMVNDPEPSWRDKFIAEANIRRAIAYRYTDIAGGMVAERGHAAGENKNSGEKAMEAESLGVAPYGAPDQGGSGGSTDPLPGALVRPDASLIAIAAKQGKDQGVAFRATKDDTTVAITELREAIAVAQRQRRAADSKLAQVREASRMFAAEMQSYRYIIASFQQKVFNLDYDIQRVLIERDALTAELAQVTNDLKRVEVQQLELEDAYWDVSKNFDRTVRLLGRYTTTDPNLARMADATGRTWLRGKVIGVGGDPRTGVVSISLGSNEGVQENQVFTIFRNEKLVGKMRVESVQANTAVGRLLPEFRGKSIVMENDNIKSAETFGGVTTSSGR